MSDNAINEVVSLHGFNVKLNLDAESTAAEASHAIDSVCAALNVAEGSAERLRLAMGKLLNNIRDRKLYEQETFEEFTEEVGNKHRLSRATLRDSMMVAERLPKLTPEQAEKIPMTSLTLVARAAKNATPAKVKTILKEAETLSRADLREKLESRNLIVHRTPQDDRITIKVMVPRRVAAQWGKVVGSQDPADVFADLIGMLANPRRKAA